MFSHAKIAGLVSIIAMLLLAGCEWEAGGGPVWNSPEDTVDRAIAVIVPTEGNDVRGTVYFVREGAGVRVTGSLRNLEPGEHGFHVHQWGDPSKANGTSMGGHFAPFDNPHGAPEDEERHVGDLGNIVANEEGVAEFSFFDEMIRLNGTASIVGRGLIVHQDEDDLESQPTGAAGARLGMAVIGVAQSERDATQGGD